MKMGTRILSAEEAKNLMKNSIMACDMGDIMSKIAEQAILGNSSLTLSYRLTEEVKKELLELGYQISNKCVNVDTIYWAI